MKFLVINADDFGYSKVFNEKILELLEKRFITSTSIMVKSIDNKQKKQIEKLKNIRNTSKISVGLHIEFENENFKDQIREQFKKFISIFEFNPDHIDLHKSTYLKNGYPAIMTFCSENNIPYRNHGISGHRAITTQYPNYDGTKKDIKETKKWLRSLKDKKEYTINFHPGTYDPASKSGLNREREIDAKKIEAIFPLFKELDIKLISFRQLKDFL